MFVRMCRTSKDVRGVCIHITHYLELPIVMLLTRYKRIYRLARHTRTHKVNVTDGLLLFAIVFQTSSIRTRVFVWCVRRRTVCSISQTLWWCFVFRSLFARYNNNRDEMESEHTHADISQTQTTSAILAGVASFDSGVCIFVWFAGGNGECVNM